MARRTQKQPAYNEAEVLENVKTLPKGKKQKYPQLIRNNEYVIKHKIEPRTYGQEFYLNTLNESTITICTGPAGTGKTWIATAVALQRLFNNEVEKIVVVKPIVEAGDEKIGYLPGDLDEKIYPHIASILDNIEDHIGPTATKRLIEAGKIVFMPAAYLRGRSLKYSFVIVDEAQNLTKKGFKLVISRLGEGTIMSINGDDDQSDLGHKESGLRWALTKLAGKHQDVGVCEMRNIDIQRHPLLTFVLDHLHD